MVIHLFSITANQPSSISCCGRYARLMHILTYDVVSSWSSSPNDFAFLYTLLWKWTKHPCIGLPFRNYVSTQLRNYAKKITPDKSVTEGLKSVIT